jgi:hypothetical protein
MLIPSERWAAQRRQHLSLLRLPEHPAEFIASLVAAARQGLDSVGRALDRGELSITEGDISLPKLEAQAVSPVVGQARDAIAAHIGTSQLPELLLAMDVQTRFGKTLLGRIPQSEHELLLTYGALLGHGTAMNATEVGLMIPSLSPAEISSAMKSLEADDSIGKANKLIVEIHRSIARDETVGRWEVRLGRHDELTDVPASLECTARPSSQDGIDGHVYACLEPVANHLPSAYRIGHTTSGCRH